ncbi:hypothetical protein EW093_15895 [Thiospirochaeta perfilievii]|uniref:Uncharacterized protein n=1 Tax=Thiospirochaeta perfilievii TaxID=252967 RepID=A0A5C1QHT5_9SPIO|nr:hypothetical protein [Thiospirochaeta perfilievii]QEN06104.1 hypothetical protein EW093_15895 [Thiospirochaeta perfilievii]
MKNSLLFILLIICNVMFALDSNTYFTLNNFHFDSNNNITSSNYDYEYGEIISQEISDGLNLDAGITKSLISDWSIFTDFRISNDLFGFNLGIFTNFLNGGSKILTPGLNYGLDFVIPGFFLVNLDLNNTIPNTSPLESGVNINNYNIKIGFYIGEAIISGNMESESSTKGTILTSTSTVDNKYFLNMDLFNKYTKYRISIDLGWNFIARSINTLNSELSVDDEITLTSLATTNKQAATLYLTTNFTLLFLENFTIDVGTTLHLIKFPLKDVDTFSSNEFSWGLNIGIIYRL